MKKFTGSRYLGFYLEADIYETKGGHEVEIVFRAPGLPKRVLAQKEYQLLEGMDKELEEFESILQSIPQMQLALGGFLKAVLPVAGYRIITGAG